MRFAISLAALMVAVAVHAQILDSAPVIHIVERSQQERLLPEGKALRPISVQGRVHDQSGKAIAAARVILKSLSGTVYAGESGAEGLFRLPEEISKRPPLPLAAGNYTVTVEKEGLPQATLSALPLTAGELVILDVVLPVPASLQPDVGPAGVPGLRTSPLPPAASTSAYPGARSVPPEISPTEAPPEIVPPDSANFRTEADRWWIPMPEWRRYAGQPDAPYVKGHWYDPFNRNRFKGDYPIFGQQWFLNFTGESITSVEARRLNLPSGASGAGGNNFPFFGRGEQSFSSQTFRFSFDLFRGDTSFRPVDFRIRFTPEFNLNFLQTRERGLVNIDVRKGINRFDEHVGVQEAFVEAKLRNLSVNYDFVSVRAGIQQFNSDFRGFLFSEEQPGIRLFGTLRSNRINYNAAWFYLLEKNTNSGLNTFQKREQQVYVANVYIQDFLKKGFTNEFSFHYNRDDPSIHFDDNGFLVRPAPVGLVVNNGVLTHGIRAYYLGWTSNGHIGPMNVSHAFYQALGHDTLNPIAGRRVDINAQLAALELSVDRDWARFRTSFLYASGDSSNRAGASRTDGTARGFDTIVDNTHFAGSDFSFFNHEGLRLTGAGVNLVGPASLLPSLRSSKEEGQANFVNPGIWLWNLGADFEVTPKLKAFVNGNYLRFDRTEPVEIVLFQRPIHHAIGTDLGIGAEYRPPLSENIVVRAGFSSLIPGRGFEDIFTGKTLFAGFASIKFQF
jgi:hypothetical protein